ncbi:LIM-domain binding protein-domain-containing protein [Dichotomocladium elegans]|nr:LIM-domain binding protein-domain-containing protein [Dichotomocladium elegans]
MAANAQMLKQQLPTPAMTTAPLPSAVSGISQNGIAVLKLMQFSDRLTPESEPTDISVWNNFVDDFFSPNGAFKFTLLNAETQQKRQYTIGRPCIARIFQTQYLCGVTSMQLTLDQTNIFLMPNTIMLECPRSSFIYRYSNGSLVVLSGTLTVDLITDTRNGGLKIELFNFECAIHEEFISRQYIQTVAPQPPPASKKKSKAANKKSGANILPPTPILPDSAITPWGIPARIVHLLEISDTAYLFADIPFYSIIADLSANLALCLRMKILEEQVTKSSMGPVIRQVINPATAAGMYRVGQMSGTLNSQPPMHPFGANPAAEELWKRMSQNPTSPYPITDAAYAAAAAVSPYTHHVAPSFPGSSPALPSRLNGVFSAASPDS